MLFGDDYFGGIGGRKIWGVDRFHTGFEGF